MAKDQWITSRELMAFLSLHRDNDVKVQVLGHNFAVIDCFYERTGDMIILSIDEEDPHHQDLRWAETED